MYGLVPPSLRVPEPDPTGIAPKGPEDDLIARAIERWKQLQGMRDEMSGEAPADVAYPAVPRETEPEGPGKIKTTLDILRVLATLRANSKRRDRDEDTRPIPDPPFASQHRADLAGVQERNQAAGEEERKGQFDADKQTRLGRDAYQAQVGATNRALMPLLTEGLTDKPGSTGRTSAFEAKLEALRASPFYKNADPETQRQLEERLFGVEDPALSGGSSGSRPTGQVQEAQFVMSQPFWAGLPDEEKKQIILNILGGTSKDPTDAVFARVVSTEMTYGATAEEAVSKGNAVVAAMRQGAEPAPNPAPAMDPQLQRRLETYQRLKAQHPDRVQELRERFAQDNGGVDPENLLNVGSTP